MMVQLDFSAEEQETLRDVLEGVLSDLRMEISETDTREFKEMLKQKKEVLEKLAAVLEG